MLENSLCLKYGCGPARFLIPSDGASNARAHLHKEEHEKRLRDKAPLSRGKSGERHCVAMIYGGTPAPLRSAHCVKYNFYRAGNGAGRPEEGGRER